MYIATIVLVIIRFLGVAFTAYTVLASGQAGGMNTGIVLALVAVVYLVSLIGIFQKKTWAVVLLIVISAMDLIGALMLGGSKGLGAGVFDAIVGIMAYLLYQKFKSGTVTVTTTTSTTTTSVDSSGGAINQ